MHHSDWMEASPQLLTPGQFASMSAEQRRLRNLQNMTRVAYLHQAHDEAFGLPAARRQTILDELSKGA